MAEAFSAIQRAPRYSESELVAAVRRGEDRAFEELFSRYRDRIGSYVRGMVGDHGRAEDIAQEVFVSALRRLRDTERPIAFKPWIYEIAKNACIDEFRRSRRAREVPLESDGHPTAERGLLRRDETPDLAVESKQRLDDLRGAFRGLSESHHRVLVLRELDGLSYDEIGKKMGISRRVVESTLFRARRRLREEYHELVSGKRCSQIRRLIDDGEARTVRSLGARGRRQLARHLAHCQPCRRHARLAGVDESLFTAPSLPRKIAALLPIPWLRWRKARAQDDALAGSASQPFGRIPALQNVASFLDPASSMVGVGRVAAAAAALAIAGAGAGGGLLHAVGSAHHSATVSPLHQVAPAPHHQDAPAASPAAGHAPARPFHHGSQRGRTRNGVPPGGSGGTSHTASHGATGAAGAHPATSAAAQGGSSSSSGGSATVPVRVPEATSDGSQSASSGGIQSQVPSAPSVPSAPKVLGGGGGTATGSSPSASSVQSTTQAVTQTASHATGQAVGAAKTVSGAVKVPSVP